MAFASASASSDYKLPSHPDNFVEDKLSICEEYSDQLEVPQWLFIRTLLLNSVKQVEDLIELISNIQYDLNYHTLLSVFQSSTVDSHNFFLSTFPAMVKVALRMPELFPSGTLNFLTPGVTSEVSLTREQVACLLVHMFLCTLKTPTWNKHWCTFKIWFGSDSKPAAEYLRCLLTYVSQLDSTGSPPNPMERIVFKRCVLLSSPNWALSTSCFSDDIVTLSYNLHPDPDCDVEVSFANKDVGFGVSGTQEEVKMGMSPEACVVMLLAPTLQDNETLLIQGVRQVGLYEGTGRHVEFIGPCENKQGRRSIVAMDAMELDESNGPGVNDLKEEVLLRELNKAFCGFSSLGTSRVAIATGHWGCGAFGGNKFVKILVQLMAACEANKKLIFHDIPQTNDKTFGHDLAGIVRTLSNKRITVGQLFAVLGQLSSVDNMFQALADHFYCV